MKDAYKARFAKYLGSLGWKIRVPVFGPFLSSMETEVPWVEVRNASLDFRRATVHIAPGILSFDDVRRLWETIVLYSEVS